MNNEKAVTNNYTIMNPELCQINDIMKAHVTTHNCILYGCTEMEIGI